MIDKLLRCPTDSVVEISDTYLYKPASNYRPALPQDSLNKAFTYVSETLRDGGVAIIGHTPQGYYSFLPATYVGLVYFGVITELKPLYPRALRALSFDSVVCTHMAGYLNLFGLTDTYTSRGKVLYYLDTLPTLPQSKAHTPQEYDPELVRSLTLQEDRFKRLVGVLSYSDTPPIFGFAPLISTFPRITKEEVLELYHKYKLDPPEALFKHFAKELPPIEWVDETAIIGDTHLTSAPALYRQLRSMGVTITKKGVDKLWSTQN